MLSEEQKSAIHRTIEASKMFPGFEALRESLEAILQGRRDLPINDPEWRLRNANTDPAKDAFIDGYLRRRRESLEQEGSSVR